MLAAAEGGGPSQVPFYVAGGLLAAWAVVVAAIGIKRPDFPRRQAPAQLVMGLSVVLVLGATATAVTTASKHEVHQPGKKEGGSGGDERRRSSTGNPPSGGTEPGARRSPGPSTLAVAADPNGELAYDKKRLDGRAGKVTIGFTNQSPVSHDVTIEKDGRKLAATPVISTSKTAVSAQLQPGSYTFYCSVDGHRQAGMTGTLRIS